MIFTIPTPESLEKAGAYFVGPKGGKWADAKMTIPWKEGGEKRTKKVEVDTEKRTAKPDETKKERGKAEPEDGKKRRGESKYTKRVPYTDKDGKKKYRYYYSDAAVARDAQKGEKIKLGKQFATVNDIAEDGTISLSIGENTKISVKPDQWDTLLATHYGEAYYTWAEKKAKQSVNAVMKHVSKSDLADLKGDTDKARLKDLKERIPKVYEKLKSSFSRAGVNPYRAKQVLSASLERKGWEPEARAAVIGDVITQRNQNYQTTIRAAENLAGGGPVKVGHVGAVTEISKTFQNEEKDEIAEVAAAAERELARLSELLSKVKKGNSEGGAEALSAALSSTAIQKLNMISKAFPGLVDRAVGPSRKIMEEVVSVAPATKPKSDGSSTVVFVAGEGGQPKALNAKYKLVEADDAIASHDPRSFNKRKDYPEDVQERAYHRDKAEQAKVQRNAQRLRPEFVINTNPDAVNGAPIMGPDGVVLGGNSRTMSMQLAYAKHPEKAKEMKDYLTENAHQAGFTKEDVAKFKNPILMRVIEDGGKTKQDKQLLVRQMNESFTQAMDPRTMQVAMGRKLSDETLEELGQAMDSDETLNAFLGTNRAVPFMNALQKEGIIDQRNANQYLLKGTKKLNPDGKTLVARILVGRTVGDADLLSATKPSIVENLARSVPYMAQAKAYGENYDISEDVKTALDAYNSLQYRVDTGSIPALHSDMTAQRFDSLFNQQEMFGGAHPVTNNPRANALLEVLIRKPGSTQITKVFKEYADLAKQNPEGQASMFGTPKTPNEIFKEVVSRNLPKPKKEAQQGLMLSDARFVIYGYGDDFETLKKSWGYFVGPNGGKYKDPAHKIPWKEPVKAKGRKTLGKPGAKTTDVKPLKGQVDIYEYAFKIKKDKEKKKEKDKDKIKGPVKVIPTPIKDSRKAVSKSLAPEIADAGSQASNRAPGPGLGVNFVIYPPKKPKGTGYTPELSEFLKEAAKDEVGALHTSKEDYEFQERTSLVRPIEYPEEYKEAHKDARKGSKERMAMIKKKAIETTDKPQNKATRS